jgi:alkanesulfonate monooxygenase SsuD/methylene tetrahydromethanopterin reductase-like flavin-dependent oxidoreductase (luciferase family)
MKIGIGLPSTIHNTPGSLVLEWARQAEARGFSSLGVIDRLVYGNYEPLITLATVAGATKTIRLMTTILIAPLRNPAEFAKQTASLDAISNGRLTLGLAVGGREDDYQAAEVDFHSRGKIFDHQLDVLRKVWNGQPLVESGIPIGPTPATPGGPEVLIGANSPQAMKRLGSWGDGYISGGGGPDRAKQAFEMAEAAWKEGGRDGKPRFVSGMYFGLGTNAAERSAEYIKHYYSFIGPKVEGFAASIPTTPEAITGVIKGFEAVGLDELIIWPCIAELEQIDLLADLVGNQCC